MPFMIKTRLALFLLMGTSALTVVCAAARQQHKAEKPSASAAKRPTKTGVADYLHWRRINPKPVMMDFQAASLCAPATTEKAERTVGSPHLPKYITVYVNKAGQNAMLLQRVPHFPVGTIIVKEKRTLPEDKTPELMTVMTKKPTGYDTAHGDWEYAVLEASGKIQTQGKLAKCQNCHEQQKSVDYVFKGYVP